MFAWFADNIGTIAVAVILMVIVAVIIRKQIKDRRAGKHGCGCGCSACPNKENCR